jgi:hypothetical protein
MTQYQLLLSQKITLFCSIIHLVMTLYQLLLPHLVKSYFIIVKIMFSSKYWCYQFNRYKVPAGTKNSRSVGFLLLE